MPAFVNSNVGSSRGTTLELGTKVWPCFSTKKSMKCWRISLALGITSSLEEAIKHVWISIPLTLVGLDAGKHAYDDFIKRQNANESDADADSAPHGRLAR